MAARTFDAVVVGGGIVGTACARELSRNSLRVAVCEAGDQVGGGGATAAAMGHVAVMDDSEAQFALTHFSQQLWREIAPELPVEAEYQNCGALWIASDADELAEAKRKYEAYCARGIQAELLDEAQLAEAEPNLRRGLAGALALPADAVCYPPAVARWLAQQVTADGGQILTSTRVSCFSDEGVGISTGERISAGLTVVAAGTATPDLIPEVEVRPRKGQLVMTERDPGFLRHQILELGYLKSAHAVSSDSVAFVVQPRAGGEIVIGSSRQYGVDDPAIDDSLLKRMLRHAAGYMPGLAELPVVREWTGSRPANSRKLPWIGLCPGRRNVYVATGHEGLGISTSLATARLIADEIMKRESAISRAPYQPALPTQRQHSSQGTVYSTSK